MRSLSQRKAVPGAHPLHLQRGRGWLASLEGLSVTPQLGAWGPRSVPYLEGRRPDCLAGEGESAIALGLDMLLETVRAKDAWVTRCGDQRETRCG